ncbi:LOW QUALITY PROTEIN: peroxiredoxin-2-like [Artibeus jamaicensis]|uniref:LOW QUALITY PROTEIN: peroxiredoxin-2-like n=1 Tax=Artibeus jamaicensis TaxID=9417 RepID=UPI00235A5195|nr:LOW QUALITY PROTEIN: peroxiredoxin-2-like [Artibeus jamaicensis]
MASENVHTRKPARDFQATAVVDGAFKEVKLSDYRGKYAVFFAYALDFTFMCPTEIKAFSEHAKDFRKLGCKVLGVSKDSQFTHLAWINTPQKEGGLGPLNIALLADVTRSLSHDFGMLKKDKGIAYRGLFIMDGKGAFTLSLSKICLCRAPWMRLQLVQAFQYIDEQEEVCPTGWKPSSDTVKPNVDDSKEYFSKHNYADKQVPSLGPLPLPGCPGLAQERPDLALHTPQSVALKA